MPEVPLQEELDELAARVADLEARPVGEGTVVNIDLSTVEARLTDIRDILQTLAETPLPEPPPAPTPVPGTENFAFVGDTGYDTLVAAAHAVEAGGTIDIAKGVITAPAGVISADFPVQCTLSGEGMDQSVLKYAKDGTRLAWGKALVVPRANMVVMDIGLAGARVNDSNGAGIRTEPSCKSLHVLRAKIFDNENGILTPDVADLDVLIDDSVFLNNAQASKSGRLGFSHNMYFNRANLVVFRNSQSLMPFHGHGLKSRARSTEVSDSHIQGGNHGRAIDCPNGGKLIVVGGVLETIESANQGQTVGFGHEGLQSGYEHEILFDGVTFRNFRSSGSRVYLDNRSQAVAVFRGCTFEGDGQIVGPHVIE